MVALEGSPRMGFLSRNLNDEIMQMWGKGIRGGGISTYTAPAVGTCLACSWVARREVGAEPMITATLYPTELILSPLGSRGQDIIQGTKIMLQHIMV